MLLAGLLDRSPDDGVREPMPGEGAFAPVGIRQERILEQADDFALGRAEAAGYASFEEIVLMKKAAGDGSRGRIFEGQKADLGKTAV